MRIFAVNFDSLSLISLDEKTVKIKVRARWFLSLLSSLSLDA
jgi:hypothetical protein